MRLFVTKIFSRFMDKVGLRDRDLVTASIEISDGLFDADLGGGLFKKRLARAGAGKAGGFRALLAFRAADRLIFIYGFPKNARENIREDELKALRLLAKELLSYDAEQLEKAVNGAAIRELKIDD